MIEIIGLEDKELKKVIESAFEATLDHLLQVEDVYVEMTVVTPSEIRSINNETRGVDSVTDILSFPTIDANRSCVTKKDYPRDVDYESGLVMMGELVLCLDRAKEQAEEYGHSIMREVGFLTTHGMLHLFGFDHMVAEDEQEMFSKQKIILDGIGLVR